MKRAALARIATVCIDRRYRWSDFRLFLFFCLVLKEVALGKRITMRSSIQSWSEIYHGLIPVEIDGWRLTLFNDCDTLDYSRASLERTELNEPITQKRVAGSLHGVLKPPARERLPP